MLNKRVIILSIEEARKELADYYAEQLTPQYLKELLLDPNPKAKGLHGAFPSNLIDMKAEDICALYRNLKIGQKYFNMTESEAVLLTFKASKIEEWYYRTVAERKEEQCKEQVQ